MTPLTMTARQTHDDANARSPDQTQSALSI